MDCFVALLPCANASRLSQAMTTGHDFAISPPAFFARGLHLFPTLCEQRARGIPGARCARSLACSLKKHASIVTTSTPVSPGIPRTMVLTATARSPWCAGLFGHHRLRFLHADLTPASGCQDHTSFPSASGTVVHGAIRVHRIPPHVS